MQICPLSLPTGPSSMSRSAPPIIPGPKVANWPAAAQLPVLPSSLICVSFWFTPCRHLSDTRPRGARPCSLVWRQVLWKLKETCIELARASSGFPASSGSYSNQKNSFYHHEQSSWWVSWLCVRSLFWQGRAWRLWGRVRVYQWRVRKGSRSSLWRCCSIAWARPAFWQAEIAPCRAIAPRTAPLACRRMGVHDA